MPEQQLTAILLLSCPDQIGLVARISKFIADHGWNIIDIDEHVDIDDDTFFIRASWNLDSTSMSTQQLKEAFAPLGNELNANWEINFRHHKQRTAIFVSKYDHCLQEILWRYSLGEFNIEIPLIISNHPNLESLATHYNIPYYVFPITKANKQEQEAKELDLLREHRVDSIVLARYMQILSGDFVDRFPNRIINIHHSFLPAFVGANPYKQAYQRGVKIIGATSHYVTEKLDQGPIIEQDITRISHRDKLNDLIRKGRDLERLVLARALQYDSENRVLVHGKKTIIF